MLKLTLRHNVNKIISPTFISFSLIVFRLDKTTVFIFLNSNFKCINAFEITMNVYNKVKLEK